MLSRWLKRAVMPFLFLAILVSFLLSATSVQADLSNITVTPLLTDADMSDSLQLVVNPGETHHLTISLTNFGSTSVTLVIRPRNAGTTQAGQLTYDGDAYPGVNGLQVAFRDISAGKMVKVAPQRTKQVELTVKIPKKPFTGTVLAAYSIYDGRTGPDGGTISVPVSITENNPARSGSLTLQGLKPELINQEPYLTVQLVNTQSDPVNDVTAHVTISRLGFLESVGLGYDSRTVTRRYAIVAPNSIIPLPISQRQVPIRAGRYRVRGWITDGTTVTNFNRIYQVSGPAAQTVNTMAKRLSPNNVLYYILAILVIVILISVCLALIVWQLRYHPRH